ncbi:uncharacterized protein TNCV_4649951 [Trichonephila clavipes]|uniref:Uncharacterized protein n=1 Tax=Trichonephila clavipes TaxID=2585209 RepID=A0A8X6SXL3_TRICX|nr:uncharacterized protein TNCV_4649951 [Trichonephila clavipes]
MKTAGWSTRRLAGQVDRSECAVRNCCIVDTRRYPRAEKPGLSEQKDHEEKEDRRIVRQALVDPTDLLKWSPGAIFQQDNARPHAARFAQDFLRHFDLPWPARSPICPVEHLWDQINGRCHRVTLYMI